MDKLLLWTPTLANVSWVKKQEFPVVSWLQAPFKKETPVSTYSNTGEAKRIYPVDKAMLQERRREMSPAKKDPVLDFFNSNAPEWLRIDPEDVDILAQLAKEDYPDLSWQERIQKAVEYLPDLLLSKKQSAEANKPKPTQQQLAQQYHREYIQQPISNAVNALTVNKTSENPLLRAWKGVLWTGVGLLKWAFKWITWWIEELVNDSKAIIADETKKPIEKFNQILLWEWLGDFIGKNVIWETFWWALSWLYNWFTTEKEREGINESMWEWVKEVFEWYIKGTKAEDVLQKFQALPEKDQKELTDLLWYAMSYTNFYGLWKGTEIAKDVWWDVIEQWAKQLTKAPTMLSKITQPVIDATWRAQKWVQSKANKVAEWRTASTFKQPALREKYISKVWQTPEVTLLEDGITWSLPSQTKQVLSKAKVSRDKARTMASKIPDTFASKEWEWITSKILEWVDTSIPWVEKKLAPIIAMKERFVKWTATANDLIDAKTYLTRYEQVYDDFWRVKKTWDVFEKEALADMYTTMKNQLEDLWGQYWIDFQKINNDTMKYEWLRDLMTRAMSREANRDAFSLSDYILWWVWVWVDPVSTTAIILWKKILQNPLTSSKGANRLYTKTWKLPFTPRKTNAPSVLRTADSIIPSKGIWVKALPAPKATVVPWDWLPQVGQPIAPLSTRTPNITETGMENVKLPQTTKTAPLVKSIAGKTK